jgi:Family of unknown function (DUF6510)
MHTDGNAIAGLLEEIFARDATAAERVCQSCRAQRHIGAHRLHRGAGLVLRCPACGDVAASIVTLPDGYAISIRGTWLFGRAPDANHDNDQGGTP